MTPASCVTSTTVSTPGPYGWGRGHPHRGGPAAAPARRREGHDDVLLRAATPRRRPPGRAVARGAGRGRAHPDPEGGPRRARPATAARRQTRCSRTRSRWSPRSPGRRSSSSTSSARASGRRCSTGSSSAASSSDVGRRCWGCSPGRRGPPRTPGTRRRCGSGSRRHSWRAASPTRHRCPGGLAGRSRPGAQGRRARRGPGQDGQEACQGGRRGSLGERRGPRQRAGVPGGRDGGSHGKHGCRIGGQRLVIC